MNRYVFHSSFGRNLFICAANIHYFTFAARIIRISSWLFFKKVREQRYFFSFSWNYSQTFITFAPIFLTDRK